MKESHSHPTETGFRARARARARILRLLWDSTRAGTGEMCTGSRRTYLNGQLLTVT